MLYPDVLQNLIDSFKRLPGIGEKTAERLAFSIFDLEDEYVQLFAQSLLSLKTDIKECGECGLITNENKCSVCSDSTRDSSVLCIVEDSRDVFLFEKIGHFHGLYHVLNGLISPLDGVGPDDINLSNLIDRIEKNKVKEVILAVKGNIEGETTSLYIKKKLSDYDVMVSRIASGIPVGADIEYIDSLTLESALNNRTALN